jgi:hypothetical protein
MRRLSRFAAGLLSGLLLAGCTTPSTPASRTTPAPAVVVIPATIRGSEETSTMLDNFTAFISALDDQPIGRGRAGWNQPITFNPGPRRLAVEFVRGAFFARTELVLDAKPGAAYELRHASDAQVYGGHTFCEFWIVELATGEKTAAPKRVALAKLKTGG